MCLVDAVHSSFVRGWWTLVLTHFNMHAWCLVAGRMFMETLPLKTDELISYVACKLLIAGKHSTWHPIVFTWKIFSRFSYSTFDILSKLFSITHLELLCGQLGSAYCVCSGISISTTWYAGPMIHRQADLRNTIMSILKVAEIP